ncbi:MAG: SDR family oxidoreductase [Verrucomicrobia bacterium]|nr:SDR family oxidoreductase [Verrucomicrobiota bacterium]
MSRPVALVTGCSRGIGQAIARRLLAEEFQVLGTATRPEAAASMPAGVEFVAVDFSDPASLEKFCGWLRERPRLDACINNAGINRIKPIEEVTPEDYREVMAVDLDAPYAICRAAASVMTRAGTGRIVNVASIWSVVTKAHRSLYSTAKAGLAGLTRALAAELGPAGILVNTVSPGFVETDLTRRSLSEAEMEALRRQIPCRRLAQPEEIAELVAFLSGPRNSYLTGQNIVMDGGFTIV